jgi:hypothetical protein
MADQALRDLKARIRLDTTDLQNGSKRAKTASSTMGAELEKADTKASKLGSTFLRVNENLGKFGPIGASVTSRLDDIGLGSGAAEGGLAGIAVAGAGAAAVLGFELAKSASDVNEQLTASRVVFGSSADVIERYAKGMASAGLSEKDALEATTNIATGLKAVGFTDASLVKVSTTLTSLATDLSSFSNIPVPDALEAIQAALRGEFDPLERFGIHLNQDAVNAEAMKEGLASSTQQISAQAKAAATINLILGQTATQQNDVARSGGTLASNLRELNAEMENNKATLGNQLLPEMVKVSSAAVELSGAIAAVSQKMQIGATTGPEWVQTLNDATTKSIGLLNPLFQLSTVVDLLSDKHKSATKATTDYGNATIKASDLVKTAAQNQKALNDSLQKTHDLLLGTFNADLQYQQAQLSTHDAIVSVDDATKAYNETVREHGAKSREAADAAEALQKAQLDVRQSALQEAQAAEQLASANAQMGNGSLSAQAALAAQRDELQHVANTLAPNSPLRVYIQQYIDKLNNQIPREIQTHFNVIFSSSGAISTSGEAFIPRAAGGPVVPGRIYTVGEHGPETLVMGSRGGVVIPNASSADRPPAANITNNYTINDATNPDLVAMAIDRRIARAFAT